ncbi:MAG TPA: hypothetical protein VH881_07930 [Burkholderiales bacterium]
MQPGSNSMSFFVTSVGSGKGADLGGLAGADGHCQSLAQAAGAGGKTWRAYLSTQATGGLADPKAIHARDRIGAGPWYNAKGVMIARNIEELHSARNNVTKETAVDERGRMVNGRTEKPNKHDILTGSRPDGTAFPPSPPFGDMTCGNWTKSGADGAVMVGHHDRSGPVTHAWATSWNSAHPSRGGCTQKALQGTGGDGFFYCFAIN